MSLLRKRPAICRECFAKCEKRPPAGESDSARRAFQLPTGKKLPGPRPQLTHEDTVTVLNFTVAAQFRAIPLLVSHISSGVKLTKTSTLYKAEIGVDNETIESRASGAEFIGPAV